MSNFVSFKNSPLNLEEINNLVSSASCGAISMFIGTTRDNFNGKSVINLEYEAYESMGVKAMEKICIDLRKEWSDIENIVIQHRLGKVPIKEASVIIAISSPHRLDALKATESCINYLKQSVPIWKKEIYANNETAWKENKECKWSNPSENNDDEDFPIKIPKRKRIKFDIIHPVQAEYIPSHLVQIKATNNEVQERIEKFMERKREEINSHNEREFFNHREEKCDFSCARIDAIIKKRKDSKSHLLVERVLNSYQHRDQKSLDYMKKYIPKNGIEERLNILESQLSLDKPVPINIYKKLKYLEDRLLHLESLSPEYIQFWEKSSSVTPKSVKKKIFSKSEIDELINELESTKKLTNK